MNQGLARITMTALTAVCGLAASASAVPTLTTLGGGTPLSVTNSIGGTTYIAGSGIATAGAARWVLTSSSLTASDIAGAAGSGAGFMSQDGLFVTGGLLNSAPMILGNTATSVTPAYSQTPTLVPSTTLPAATEFGGGRWSVAGSTWKRVGGMPVVPSLLVFGTSSGGGSTNNFMTPNGISSTGQFIVGLGYVCTYNNAGSAISANSFRWRPWIWDANANAGAGAVTILPTPFKTTAGQTSLRRTGNAYAVSADGLVIAGAQEHNVGTSPAADADGGRFVVWRWDAGTSQYVMSYLDTGVDGNGFPKYMSSTPSSLVMNAAGTIIAARGPDGITKWEWNGSTWGAPIVIGSNLSTPASWLPASVTGCAVPPSLGAILSMSEDGSIITGTAVYSTCGSFMSGGFIWHESDNLIQDWYDFNVAQGTPNVGPGLLFSPVGDNGDPAKGLPTLGYPSAISPDGTTIVGYQGGTQRIPGAPTWVWSESGLGCIAPTVTANPAATTNFTACSSSIILNTTASGSGPFTYQWYKNGNPLSNGSSGFGSDITGADSYQFRITPPSGFTLSASEAGTYHCVVTGSCGTPATTSTAVVQLDPSVSVAINDTCSTATTLSQGTNVIAPAQSICGAYNLDPVNGASCALTKTDLWYNFTPANTGEYRIETCGANFDTVLSIFDGCGGSEIACNNDADPNTGPTCGSTTRSRVSPVTLTGGTTYKIRIAAQGTAFLSSTSTANISINAAPTLPANDACGAATAAIEGANPFNTTEASPDGISPVACATSAHLSRDVWFSFNAPVGGKLSASTCPQGTASGGYSLMNNTVVTLHDNPCGNVLVCNDNHSPVPSGCGTQLSSFGNFAMATGQTVYFRVSGSNATTHGQGILNVNLTCFADLDNDGVFPGATTDGAVDINDLLYFLAGFEAGDVSVDLDNDGDAAAGVTDGAVDINDLLFFLARFEAGC